MNKLFLTLLSTSVMLLPAVSFAEIKSIDGLSTEKQFLATTSDASTMHMKITTTASKNHVFSWDTTAWAVAQGGTGVTSFTPGSIIFMSSSTLSQNNASFFWDTINAALNLGVSGAQSLVARLTVKGAPGQAIANFVSSSGISNLFVAATGYVGIGTTNPLHALDVVGAMYSRLVDNGASATIDWNTGNVQKVSLTSDAAFTFSNARAGGEYKLIFTQDAVGGHSITWPANVKWPNNTTPILNTTADGTSIASFVYDGANFFASPILSYANAPAALSLLTPTSGTSFNTVISDTSSGLYICDPNHTCETIGFTSGFSDQCAYMAQTDLAANGGHVGPRYYTDENGQINSPCDESMPGTWKVRQYLYNGSTFVWTGPIQTFTVTAPSLTLTPSSGNSFNTVISDTSHSIIICQPGQSCDNLTVTGGPFNNCAYAGFTSLAAEGGNILAATAHEYAGTPFGPFGQCIATTPGVWGVRQYDYNGSTFSWAGPIQTFTVTP